MHSDYATQSFRSVGFSYVMRYRFPPSACPLMGLLAQVSTDSPTGRIAQAFSRSIMLTEEDISVKFAEPHLVGFSVKLRGEGAEI